MASIISKYVRKGAGKVRSGLSTVGSYLLKPLDSLEESRKQMQEARNNSAPAYRRMKEEEERRKNEQQRREDQMKKDMEAKSKGATSTKSYMRKK